MKWCIVSIPETVCAFLFQEQPADWFTLWNEEPFQTTMHCAKLQQVASPRSFFKIYFKAI